MEFEELLNKYFNNLNETDKIIAQWLINHRTQIKRMTITDVSKNCAVSRSSVFRFSQKLGLEGFNQLRYILMTSPQVEKISSDHHQDILRAVTNTIKRFQNKKNEPIFKILENATDIYIYSTGWIQKVVSEQLQRNFFLIGKNAYILPAAFDELITTLNRMKKNDVIFIISYSGNHAQLNDCIKSASLSGIKTVSITPFFQNELSAQTTESLYFDAIENDSHQFNNTLDFYSGLFVLSDLLITEYIKYLEDDNKN